MILDRTMFIELHASKLVAILCMEISITNTVIVHANASTIGVVYNQGIKDSKYI